jgi:hypothetical protein
MIQKVLHFVGGIEQYGVASLCLFGVIFICVFTWAFLQKRSHLDYMARVALEPGEDELREREPAVRSDNYRSSTLHSISHE